MRIKWGEKKEKIFFYVLVFVFALIACSQIKYTDGDDAFFYHYSNTMNFFEYIKWRYLSWTGRVSSETMMYLIFNVNIWAWRVINAFMLVFLPYSMLTLLKVVSEADIESSKLLYNGERKKVTALALVVIHTLCFFCYLLMDINTLGYACFWITGSMNYLWSFVCGLWVLIPLAKYVYQEERLSFGKLAYAIPCSAIATMAAEQMGAVILAFILICILHTWIKGKRTEIGIWALLFSTLLSFIILFAAPGNDLRVQVAIETCMPQYSTLTFGEHAFITIQWVLSSFANENVLFMCLIWIFGILLLEKKKNPQNRRQLGICQILTGICVLSGVCAWTGRTFFSDLGLDIEDITQKMEQVPMLDDLTVGQMLVCLWWIVALLYTLGLLCVVSDKGILMCLIYAGSIACEAVLFFSPTMYSSGERVYFLSDIMLMFIGLFLYSALKEKKNRYIGVGLITCFGILNLIKQVIERLSYFS